MPVMLAIFALACHAAHYQPQRAADISSHLYYQRYLSLHHSGHCLSAIALALPECQFYAASPNNPNITVTLLAMPHTSSYSDRYGNDVLARDSGQPLSTHLPAEVGMVVEDATTGYVGEVMAVRKVSGQWLVELEDRTLRRKSFPLGAGFLIEGHPVILDPPPTQPVSAPARMVTASGSFHVEFDARVAQPSRIWVEGKHDADLVSYIWGTDLAYEGIMIEELFGADNLPAIMDVFQPSWNRRAGIMLDHMVTGSKEDRIARQVSNRPGVLVLGHPYVDIWHAIKPQRLGLQAWPDVPRTEDFKLGTLRRIGWPCKDAEDVGMAWARMKEAVRDYRDLEPAFLGRMEELIDFVTDPSLGHGAAS
ncbi:DUF3097 family protein [Trueperella sp. LYQ141]|uniref:DUF3097 family protein n=1 Tax=Trueperella sp. LYQ141 TaxID=3391058 RepID=UPI0039833289